MCKRIPIYREENVLYQREEKSGYWTFIPKFHPETRELIVNRTSKEILNLCNGNNTLEEIEDMMKKKYPDVNEYIIINDVRKTISSFSRLGIIDWEGENPFLYINEEPLRNGYTMRVAQENDHRAIHKFLSELNSIDHERYIFYRSPIALTNEYNEVSLRQKLFAFSEDFFLLLKNGKIHGVISIAMPLLFVETSAIIKNIICPVEFFEESPGG
ncbi:MAG: PqqD family protein [Bacteroidetes bacterium]|nr:MAG: PqqD family protein [Bacteroidota bacterium]